jgi:diadenylate cyclase
MTGITNLIAGKFSGIDYTNPLTLIDLLVALFLVVGFLVYIKRFPVFRVVMGILFLIVCSLVFLIIGFVYTALVFGVVSNVILISLPLIFAPEVRHYLEKLGRFSFVRFPRITDNQKKSAFIQDLVNAVYELSERKIGATIVIARKTGIAATIETGVEIDAKFSTKLIQNLFFPKSPLHDGAVVVQGDRIIAAGCLLPISARIRLDSPFGTRHRSGLAITMDTDAVTVLVSEERGHVSIAENGKMKINIDRVELAQELHQLLR